jgi:hypothetical protein
VHIMAPAKNYEAPTLAVSTLTETQYVELTQEQHPVTDWNHIILSISRLEDLT